MAYAKPRIKKPNVYPRTGFRASFNSNAAESLRLVRTEIAEKVLRSAALGGAEKFYDVMHMKVNVVTGTLKGSLYHYYDKQESKPLHKIYYVGPNKAKAPHWYNVEFGHWRYNRSMGMRWMRSKSRRNARLAKPGVMDHKIHDLPGALEIPAWVPPKSYIRSTFDMSVQAAIRQAQDRAAARWAKEIADMRMPQK